jgi:hypothetical protein
MRTARENVLRRAGDASHNQPVFFVTLVDMCCATDLSANVDLAGIKRRLRVGLRGLSYIGVVEPAFYTNLQIGVRFQGKRCLFWHVHALVWDVSRSKLQSLLRKQRAQGKFVAIAEGFKGTDTRKVKQGDLPKVLGYLLKSPSVAYRVSRQDMKQPNGDWLLTDDGEVKAKFFQHKPRFGPVNGYGYFTPRRTVIWISWHSREGTAGHYWRKRSVWRFLINARHRHCWGHHPRLFHISAAA